MRSLALASAVLVLAACPGLDQVADPQDPIADPTSETTSTPTPASLTGTWQVTSQFEVPATVAAPGPLGQSLQLLHQLNENPAGALLDMAELAGVPALDTLRLALPSTLEDQLEDWMNGYLDAATVNGSSPHARIAALDDRIRSVLLDWELRSTLALPASGPGTHAPGALVFSAAGEPVVVPVSETAPVTAGTGVTATVTWPAGAGQPSVAIGDHSMGVPFGRYALQGLGAILEREYGAPSVGAAFAVIVDCDGLARSVAGRCVDAGLFELCVDHASELEEICAAGVARAASELEARILAIDYRAIHFASGTATVEGAPVTAATATALTAGTWASTIDLGQTDEPEAATATFRAVRAP